MLLHLAPRKSNLSYINPILRLTETDIISVYAFHSPTWCNEVTDCLKSQTVDVQFAVFGNI